MRVYVRSLCYGYQFSIILKLELITVTTLIKGHKQHRFSIRPRGQSYWLPVLIHYIPSFLLSPEVFVFFSKTKSPRNTGFSGASRLDSVYDFWTNLWLQSRSRIPSSKMCLLLLIPVNWFSTPCRTYRSNTGSRLWLKPACQQKLMQLLLPISLLICMGNLQRLRKGPVLSFYLSTGLWPQWWRCSVLFSMARQKRWKLPPTELRSIVRL